MISNNNWHVVTGGPSSGKTTLVDEMAKLGYATCPEPARTYIDRQIATGKTLPEISRDMAKYQNEILKTALEIRESAPKNKIVFFDRSVCDLTAYNEFYGLDASEPRRRCGEIRYGKIFFLEQLEFTPDYARVEDRETARKLSAAIKKVYRGLGYEIISLPPAPLAERVKTVLKEISAGN